MSDNELDNLFKEAADGFKPPHDPSAWQDMSRKLDVATAAPSFWNWKTISSTVMVGVAVVALLLYVSLPDSGASSEVKDQMISSSDAPKKQTPEKDIVDLKSSSNLKTDETQVAKENEPKSASAGEHEENSSVANATSKVSGGEVAESVERKNVSEPQSSVSQQNSQSLKKQSTQRENAIASGSTNKSQIRKGDTKSRTAIGVAVVTGNAAVQKSSDVVVSGGRASNLTDAKRPNSKTAPVEGITAITTEVTATEKSFDPTSTGSVTSEVRDSKQVSSNANTMDAKTEIIAGTGDPVKKSDETSSVAVATVAEKEIEKPAGTARTTSAAIVAQGEGNSTQAASKTSGIQNQSLVATDSLKKPVEETKAVAVADESSSQDEAKPKEEKSTFNRFAIKLAISPDYSTVKSTTPNGLGINYGALIEYRITKHWSIATGGIWSKKIYSANDVEYNGYHADWVDGDCRMWDIPINVYYNFASQKPFSFYASMGFSSYLMNEENYVYYVETAYGTYDYPKQVKGENNEWFKTLNLSVGMQFRMSQQFSLQFEPTLKAPLAGVGEGEVSLVSLGAFFNLRYEIPFNKIRRNED